MGPSALLAAAALIVIAAVNMASADVWVRFNLKNFPVGKAPVAGDCDSKTASITDQTFWMAPPWSWQGQKVTDQDGKTWSWNVSLAAICVPDKTLTCDNFGLCSGFGPGTPCRVGNATRDDKQVTYSAKKLDCEVKTGSFICVKFDAACCVDKVFHEGGGLKWDALVGVGISLNVLLVLVRWWFGDRAWLPEVMWFLSTSEFAIAVAVSAVMVPACPTNCEGTKACTINIAYPTALFLLSILWFAYAVLLRRTKTVNMWSSFKYSGFRNSSGGADENTVLTAWVVPSADKAKSDKVFDMIQVDGRTGGKETWDEFSKRKLPNKVMTRAWELSDIDKDEHLDKDEFALMYYLVNMAQSGHPLPHVLPENFVPPSKRR